MTEANAELSPFTLSAEILYSAVSLKLQLQPTRIIMI